MPYLNFESLAAKEKLGKDYAIEFSNRNSQVAFMAIHGGNIEPYTSEIAQYLAGEEYSFYTFKGLKKSGNNILHLSSNKFNEFQAVTLAHSTYLVVTIHGMKGKHDKVVIGGLNNKIINLLVTELNKNNFSTETTTNYPHLVGTLASNICNQCITNQGVQIEISLGLRKKLMADTKLLDKFKNIILASVILSPSEGSN